jgi:hypothetical protein
MSTNLHWISEMKIKTGVSKIQVPKNASKESPVISSTHVAIGCAKVQIKGKCTRYKENEILPIYWINGVVKGFCSTGKFSRARRRRTEPIDPQKYIRS